MKNILIVIITLISQTSISQDTLQPRKVEYYFEQLMDAMINNLQNDNALDDSLKLKDKFFDIINGEKRLNEKGIELYTNVRIEAHKLLFKTWNYQQHLIKDNYVYVLYFSIAGLEDLEWQVVRFKKEKWSNQLTLEKEKLKKLSLKLEFNEINSENLDFIPLFFNWDEGPKNTENVNIFIKNDYLILERGDLYHSLYDLRSQKTIINIECPWCESDAKDKESMNLWIRENLHDQIQIEIEDSR